ncbi:unnamed protein product [Cylicocyclus nassatus]|uniref:Uncharacterized protein n=1 Tax=Cylicocyclus nassatus TaxID=53992 RepID=A0AA36HD70_CYLNA|nr:unnamed protein product [Cylicocyclus nassatus]
MYHDKMSAVTYRTETTAFYIVPYYTLISPLILSYAIRSAEKMRAAKLKQMTNRKDENDAYAQMYIKMWRS